MPVLTRNAAKHRSLLARALPLATVLGAMALVVAPAASGAEPGVNVLNSSPAQDTAIGALGTHWVRLFLTWPDLEPQRGVFAPNWFASYGQTFRSLPAGTKVLLDVVGTPSWESGSANEHTPPANPYDY